MTEKQVDNMKAKIDKMSHEDMALLWRFAPIGGPTGLVRHTLFGNEELAVYFTDRFVKAGGMTQELSEKLSPITSE